MNTSIRNIHLTEFEGIYKRITLDFPEGEYPPCDKLYMQLENNLQKGWILVHEGRDVAYSICAEGTDYNFILISFFAVFEEYRDKGIGTLFIDKIKELYSKADGIIVEVEKVEAALHEEDVFMRERRLQFYKRAGFTLVPGIEYTIWDVPMELMIFPCKSSLKVINQDIGKIIHDIYFPLLGNQFINKLEFKRIVD